MKITNYSTLFKKCNSMDQLKQIHSQTILTGLASQSIVLNKIIDFCCTHEFGDMNYACVVFDKIPDPNVYIWNTVIKGYCRIKCPSFAFSMYVDMLRRNIRPDNYTYPFLFKGFTRDMAVDYGRVLHSHVVQFGFDFDVYVQNGLVHMYILCGEIDIARVLFDMCLKKDVVTWNTLISGYNRNKRFHESVKLFAEMEEQRVVPTSVTLISVLSACSKLKDLDVGKRVHWYVQDCEVLPTLVLENALIDMYAVCGEIGTAVKLFEGMKYKDVISWTAIVKGFANLGQLDLAQKYFEQIPEKDLVSWTAIIDGYLRANQFKEVLTLFRRMQTTDVKPDKFTMVSILTACAHLCALELGEWIKAYIDKNNIKTDHFVGNALIDLYFKCGNVEKAFTIYNEMHHIDKFTWTAMIVGLATNGHGEEALNMFSKMLQNFIVPDEITYIGVLSACNHSGMVDQGRVFFKNMTVQHGIVPNVMHYGCMVDLLGRSGNLQEAHNVITNMPMRPNSIIWGSLLSACRVHRNAEMAEMAATKILEMEPENGAVYVMLCNIYAACNKYEDLRVLRNLMMEKGIKKIPGCSLIEMNGSVHEFVAGDQSHPQCKQIYSKLIEIREDMQKIAGYVPDTSEVFLNIGEEDKESSVYQHSEKLAIAFGLINSGHGVPIRIVKNLRMCVDCHHVAKLVSKVYGREVIVRDRTRFHHFRNGLCSCKEYW